MKKRNLFKLKLQIVFDILTGRINSFVIISLTRKNTLKLLEGKNYTAYSVLYRMSDYVGNRIIKDLGKPELELFLDRLTFETEAEEYLKKQIKQTTKK